MKNMVAELKIIQKFKSKIIQQVLLKGGEGDPAEAPIGFGIYVIIVNKE